jgi:hypothetical protein
MDCPELTERDYFTLVRADKPEDCCPPRRKALVFVHVCPSEDSDKPVFYTVISRIAASKCKIYYWTVPTGGR